MNTSRTSMRNGWVGIGYRAQKSSIPIERVLTGKAPDKFIRIGFEAAAQGKAITTACRQAKKSEA